jgi:hypothetical protein
VKTRARSPPGWNCGLGGIKLKDPRLGLVEVKAGGLLES